VFRDSAGRDNAQKKNQSAEGGGCGADGRDEVTAFLWDAL
jgi:hypothetical protein